MSDEVITVQIDGQDDGGAVIRFGTNKLLRGVSIDVEHAYGTLRIGLGARELDQVIEALQRARKAIAR